MLFTSIPVLLFAVLLRFAADVGGQCIEAQEGERLRQTSAALVEGESDCKLIQTLQSFASRLDAHSRPVFDLLVVDINNRVIANESMPMMSVVTLSAYKLMNYVIQHPHFREDLESMRLGDWGTIRDLFVVGAKVKADTVESVITNVNGRTALLAALEDSKATFPNEIERIRIDELISDLENQVARHDLSLTNRMTRIHQVFTEWFGHYAYIKPYLLAQTPNLDRWGSLMAFLDVAGHFYRTHTMNDMFAPNGTMDSTVSSMLGEAVDTTPYLSRIERVVFRDFNSKIKIVGDEPALGGSTKLFIIRDELRKILVTKKIRSVKLSDEFGSFGDMLDVNNFMSCPKADDRKMENQSEEIRKKRALSESLAARPPAGGDCELISSLLKYSSTLPAPKMIKFDVVLFKVNQTIVNDPSLNRTEALARSVFRIKEAVRRIQGLSEALEFADIGQWGTLHELFIAAQVIKSETLDYGIAHLIPALEQFALGLPPPAIDDTNHLISELMSILAAPTGSSAELKYSVAYLTLEEFLVRRPELFERFRETKIAEWGNVGMLHDVLAQYHRLSALDKLFRMQNRQSALARDLAASSSLAPDLIERISAISSDPAVMDLWKLEMIVREFRTYIAEHWELNTRLRAMPVGNSFLFGTFGDLIDLYYFKSMKAGKLKRRPAPRPHALAQSVEVQDNDDPNISGNRIAQRNPSVGNGDCAQVERLFVLGADHFFPVTRSLDEASAHLEGSQRRAFRTTISRIHNRILFTPRMTVEEKLMTTVRELRDYVGYSATRSQQISNLQLSDWGSVAQLFGCQ